MTQTFEDHFSAQSHTYAAYRPQYPPQLFDHLASISPGRQLAWDCGTGNGQAALELAKRFEHVIATDGSADQIAQSTQHERIEYRVERAEEVDIEPGSVDLITVAMAVHWFDLEPFYQVVRRVAKTSAILAVWIYYLPIIDEPIDALLNHYYADVLGSYWPERVHFVDKLYRTLPFPFEELTPPEFEIRADWELRQLFGFLDSWSATQRYLKANGEHPLHLIWPELSKQWGEPDRRRTIRWKLYFRIGMV